MTTLRAAGCCRLLENQITDNRLSQLSYIEQPYAGSAVRRAQADYGSVYWYLGYAQTSTVASYVPNPPVSSAKNQKKMAVFSFSFLLNFRDRRPTKPTLSTLASREREEQNSKGAGEQERRRAEAITEPPNSLVLAI